MLLQAEESSRKEEEDTRRRLAKETDAWQKQVHASARKEAQERDEVAKREARDKVRRGQPFRRVVLSLLLLLLVVAVLLVKSIVERVVKCPSFNSKRFLVLGGSAGLDQSAPKHRKLVQVQI